MSVLTPDEVEELAGWITDRLIARQIDWDRHFETDHGRRPTEQDTAAWKEEQLQAEFVELIGERTRQGRPGLGDDDEQLVADAARIRLSPLQVVEQLLAGDLVENVTANGLVTWIHEVGGRKRRGPALAPTPEAIVDLIRRAGQIYGRTERRFDSAQPEMDLRLPDGSRLHAIMEVTGYPNLSIRKHRLVQVDMADLIKSGTIDEDLASFFRAAISRPYPTNILISGGTNAGKTTLLRAFIGEVEPWERLITIEDSLELMLDADPKREDVVSMEARKPNIEGVGEITMQMLVRSALRMRPDRLIVGECRGPEAVDMLNAMAVGNDGSLGTIHADSVFAALNRLNTYGWMAQLNDQATSSIVADSVHLVVHVTRLPDSTRVVSQVAEVTGELDDDGRPRLSRLWDTGPDGRAVRTGIAPMDRLRNRLDATGYSFGGAR